jgi:site-specific DNA-cytosine methylase
VGEGLQLKNEATLSVEIPSISDMAVPCPPPVGIDGCQPDVLGPTTTELRASRKKINELRHHIAKNIVSLLGEVDKYRTADTAILEDLLRDCGIADEDLRALTGAGDALRDHGELLIRERVNFPVVKALVETDEATRDQALRRIKSGEIFGVRELKRIEKQTRLDRMSRDEFAKYSNDKALSAAVAGVSRKAKTAFREKAQKLYNAIVAFDRHRRRLPRTWKVLKKRAPRYYSAHPLSAAAVDISAIAQDLLPDFQKLFGSEFPEIRDWAHVGLADPAKMYLAQAHWGLKRLAQRPYDEVGSLGDQSEFYEWNALEAIGCLAGIQPETLDPPNTIDRAHSGQLTAVEFCAGSGGSHALGLQSVGYKIQGLLAADDVAKAVLLKNRPDWNIDVISNDELAMTAAISQFFDVKLINPGQLDLLAGTLPTRPWSIKGTGFGDKTDLLGAATKLVSKVQPRAFAFELDSGFLSGRHQQARQQVLAELKDAGYATKLIKTDAAEHGSPQKRTRVALIGFASRRDLSLRTFQLRKSQETSFGDLYGRQIFPWYPPYRTAPHTETVDPTPKAREDLVRKWLKMNATAPDVSKLYQAISKRPDLQLRPWGKSGFAKRLVDQFPNESEFSGVLPLTKELLREIQGQPADWEFTGSDECQAEQLCSVTPPRICGAIGTSIRETLTGDPASELVPAIRSGKERKRFKVGGNRPHTRRWLADRWREWVDDLSHDDEQGPSILLPPVRAPVLLRPPGSPSSKTGQ